jgi:hypothetical protein
LCDAEHLDGTAAEQYRIDWERKRECYWITFFTSNGMHLSVLEVRSCNQVTLKAPAVVTDADNEASLPRGRRRETEELTMQTNKHRGF